MWNAHIAAASYRDPQAVLSPEPLQFLVHFSVQGSLATCLCVIRRWHTNT